MICRFKFLTRAAALSAAMVVLTALPAAAQTVLLGTPEFARLVQGKSIIVTRSDGTWQEGSVKSLSLTGLVVAGDGFSASVPFDQIVKVEKSSYRIRKGTLIGLAAGAGLGLTVWLSSQDFDEDPSALFICTGFGVGAGALIGAVMHLSRGDRDVIYDAKRRTTTMSLAPILSPTRKGLAFSMTWR